MHHDNRSLNDSVIVYLLSGFQIVTPQHRRSDDVIADDSLL